MKKEEILNALLKSLDKSITLLENKSNDEIKDIKTMKIFLNKEKSLIKSYLEDVTKRTLLRQKTTDDLRLGKRGSRFLTPSNNRSRILKRKYKFISKEKNNFGNLNKLKISENYKPKNELNEKNNKLQVIKDINTNEKKNYKTPIRKISSQKNLISKIKKVKKNHRNKNKDNPVLSKRNNKKNKIELTDSINRTNKSFILNNKNNLNKSNSNINMNKYSNKKNKTNSSIKKPIKINIIKKGKKNLFIEKLDTNKKSNEIIYDKNNFGDLLYTDDGRDMLLSKDNNNLKSKENKSPKNKENEALKIVEKEKDNIINKEKETNLSSFNKDKYKSLATSLPKRQNTNYSSLKDIMKSKTENLSEKEKSFIIFLWICDNISYDVDSYFAGRSVDCTPEGVFKNGSSVCSGYSRLYKDLSDYLNLEVECVNCYAKGVSYNVGEKLTSPNHEYNVIKLDNKWYPIDSTWGAGYTNGKKFIKFFNEFYFLADPELLIKTHFPVNEKWQLTQKKYTLDDFLSWPVVESQFYTFGFVKCLPDKGLIELKDSNAQKFIIYGNNINKKGASCNVYLLEGNTYKQQLNASCINFYNDRFEVYTIFNKKGKYKVVIFGNTDRRKNFIGMLEYAVNVEKEQKKKLAFPLFYSGNEDINIIEPFYDNLKSGEKVKFKIKTSLDEIIIIDKKWHRLKKNEKGFFETEIKIKSVKGENIIIGKNGDAFSCSYLVSYNVI